MIVVLTGVPGSGKTTICKKIYEEFRSKVSIAGFITEELRESGKRVGFIAVNLAIPSEKVVLAHVDFFDRTRYHVGKYGVDVKSFERFLEDVKQTVRDARLIIVDEVGKMELLSSEFERFVLELINYWSSKKLLLFVVNYFHNHPLCINLREELYDEKFVVSKENREQVFKELKALLAQNLLQ
jgi:nucleoside-triphosphatase